MDFRSLGIFCDLVDSGRVGKTAKLNGVTSSAISQQISHLERHFNVKLREPVWGELHLTQEGFVLYDAGKDMLRAYKALQSAMQEIKRAVEGKIRISTIYSIGLHCLPACLRQINEQHPSVNVLVEYRRADQVYRDVINDAADFGLVAYPTSSNGLEIVPLFNERLVLICCPDHPLAKRKRIKLDDLADHKLVNSGPDAPTGKALDKILRDYMDRIPSVMELEGIESVKQAVETGMGVSIVPETTVAREVAMKVLCALRIEGGRWYRPVAAILKSQKVLSPAMKRFLVILANRKPVIKTSLN